MTQASVNPSKIILRRIKMRLNKPFTTSFGTLDTKEFCVVEVIDENGNSGWGESVAHNEPSYNEETTVTNEHVIKDFLIPRLFHNNISHPDEVSSLFADIRKNNMAKATLETAIWDLFAKNNHMSLAKALGGAKGTIEVGKSIGIQENMNDLLKMVEKNVEEGYRKIKVKIKPGKDVGVIREIRRAFPDIPLMADANSAYTLNDIETLKQLDEFGLMMMEQPLSHDDIIDHAKLQKELSTPICLDESIHTLEDARKAIELGSCNIINIKIGRVGGLSEARKIHDLCKEHAIPVWCGGMQEAGIGRAHNIAITSLDNFIIPGDTAPSAHYWDEDIIDPPVVMNKGLIDVPEKPGIGFEVDRRTLDGKTTYLQTFEKEQTEILS